MCRSDVVGGALARAAEKETTRKGEGGVRELAGKGHPSLALEARYRDAQAQADAALAL